jgi:hypothetical protein
MSRCSRCGQESNCQSFGVQKVQVCEDCLTLIVVEWSIHQREFGELVRS